jgi:hypothetical protein
MKDSISMKIKFGYYLLIHLIKIHWGTYFRKVRTCIAAKCINTKTCLEIQLHQRKKFCRSSSSTLENFFVECGGIVPEMMKTSYSYPKFKSISINAWAKNNQAIIEIVASDSLQPFKKITANFSLIEGAMQ